ncbi:MAG: DUF4445 domain-containing protein [Lachnospiraceae bacterium]|nr:DUF4445 domain-containing protein [Lachnospiraceae bacterium]
MKIVKDDIEIYIDGNDKKYKDCTLLEMLQDYGLYVPHICKGNGTCGKCKVRLSNVDICIHEQEKKSLLEEELHQGIRLACKVKMQELWDKEDVENIVVELIEYCEDSIWIEGINCDKRKNSTLDNNICIEKNIIDNVDKLQKEYFIAIDIGTTTIAMALVESSTGEICDTYVSLNHQRALGGDVISRILASNEGKGRELKNIIEEDLWRGIKKLGQPQSANQKDEKEQDLLKIENKLRNISKIYLVGNTTMIHLLMGYSCESLGKYPFISKHLGQIECVLSECISNVNEFQKVTREDKEERNNRHTNIDNRNDTFYENISKIPVTIIPGISAFVGGDIVAGMLVCPDFEKEEISLLVDLGTNGEMVLGNRDKMLVSSTAAGPAFEGGNIICGTASIPGSICKLKIENRKPIIKTIANKLPPIGICGTGLVSAISQMRKNKILDATGRLQYPYDRNGFVLGTSQMGKKVALYQEDIRQFQMAKSAIRAGIEILIQEYGCKIEDIKCVYLAGGMGAHLQEEEAISCGILPKEFQGRTLIMGNTALLGAIEMGKMENQTIYEDDVKRKLQFILSNSFLVSLSENKDFEKLYMKYMEL